MFSGLNRHSYSEAGKTAPVANLREVDHIESGQAVADDSGYAVSRTRTADLDRNKTLLLKWVLELPDQGRSTRRSPRPAPGRCGT